MIQGNTFYLPFEPALMAFLQQGMTPALTSVVSLFTLFGEEMVLIAVLGFLYWCYDKEFGKYLGTNAMVGLVVYPMFKNVALRRRPYMDHPEIKCLKPVHKDADIYDISSQGYSFPSGHATNSVTVYSTMATRFPQKIGKILAVMIPLMVGFSRVALGVHYPTDVLFGWLLGLCILFIMPKIQKAVTEKWKLRLSLFLLSCSGILFCRSTDYFTALGIMGGFFLGCEFEERYVHFENTRNPVRCILRVLGGFVVYLTLNTLLKMPFSEEFLASAVLASFLVRACRYFIILFACIGVYPMVFRFTSKR